MFSHETPPLTRFLDYHRQILIVVFFIQISINTNASMYSHAVSGISEKHGVSSQVARIPQMAFLIAYGIGCELWAPWSEEFGRWKIQQLSLFLVNIWQVSIRFWDSPFFEGEMLRGVRGLYLGWKTDCNHRFPAVSPITTQHTSSVAL